MTNEEFINLLGTLRSLSGSKDRVATTQLQEHARKLVAIANEVRKYQLNDSLISYERLQEMVDNLEGDEDDTTRT